MGEIVHHPRFLEPERDSGGLVRLRQASGLDPSAFARAIAKELGRQLPVETYLAWERGLEGIAPPLAVMRAAARIAAQGRAEDAEMSRPPLNRREFLAFSAELVGMAVMDLEVVCAALSGLPAESVTIDGLERMMRSYRQQYDVVPPSVLLPTVRFYVACLGKLQPKTPTLARKVLGMRAEAAVMAGRLSARIHNRTDAEAFYKFAEASAREAGSAQLEALALAAHSGLYSNIDSGRPMGRPPVAVLMLDQAEAIAGRHASSLLLSWLRAHRAAEHAANGNAMASERDLESAARDLSRRATTAEDFFHGWNTRQLDGYRGCCAVLLNTPSAAAILEAAAVKMNSDMITQHAAVQIDLATAYARQGDLDKACAILSDVYATAAHHYLPEIARRIASVRRFELLGNSHAAVARLDEQIKAMPIPF